MSDYKFESGKPFIDENEKKIEILRNLSLRLFCLVEDCNMDEAERHIDSLIESQLKKIR